MATPWSLNVIPEILDSIATREDGATLSAHDAGKIIWRDGEMYRALVDTSAGPFVEGEWEEVVLADLLGTGDFLVDIAATNKFDPLKRYELGDLIVEDGLLYQPNKTTGPNPTRIAADWDPIQIKPLLDAKADNFEIAPEFSAAKTYKAGDLVYYNNDLYKANEDLPVKAWDPADWTKTNIAANLGGSISWAPVATEFSDEKNYAKDDYVIKDNKLYKAKDDITAHAWTDSEWAETNVVDNLAKGSFLNMSAAADSFAEDTPYYKGEFVSYKGDIYRALVDMSAGAFSLTNWEKLTFVPDIYTRSRKDNIANEYSAGANYKEGAVVYNNDNLYRAKEDITGAAATMDPAKWQFVRVADIFDGDLYFKQSGVADPYDAAKVYNMFDICSFKGEGYVCISETGIEGISPAADPSKWLEINLGELLLDHEMKKADRRNIARLYNGGVHYNKDDVIYNNYEEGTLYRAKEEIETAPVLFDPTQWESICIADMLGSGDYLKDISGANYYDKDHTYYAGDIIIEDGEFYQANGTTTGEPRDIDKWTKVQIVELIKGKTDNDEIAAEFAATSTYEAGDLVYHDGKLYKANEDLDPAAWDEAKWSLTNIAANLGGSISWAPVATEFSDIKTYLKDDYVIKDNKLYKAKDDIAAGTWDIDKWAETNVVDNLAKGSFLNQVAEADTYDPAVAYPKGALCTYKGDIYKSNSITTGGDFNTTLWDKFKPASEVNKKANRVDVAPAYTAGEDYAEGDLVYYDEVLYMANKDIAAAPAAFTAADWDSTDIDTCLKACNFRAAFNAAMLALGETLGFEHHYEKRGTDTVKKDYFDFKTTI